MSNTALRVGAGGVCRVKLAAPGGGGGFAVLLGTVQRTSGVRFPLNVMPFFFLFSGLIDAVCRVVSAQPVLLFQRHLGSMEPL